MGSSEKGKGYSAVESPFRVLISMYEKAETKATLSISINIINIYYYYCSLISFKLKILVFTLLL